MRQWSYMHRGSGTSFLIVGLPCFLLLREDNAVRCFYFSVTELIPQWHEYQCTCVNSPPTPTPYQCTCVNSPHPHPHPTHPHSPHPTPTHPPRPPIIPTHHPPPPTPPHRTKWPPFWQTAFSNEFSGMKMIEFRLKFH